jgi:hypothetical protein
MSKFAGDRASITPSTGVANWVLESASGGAADVQEVSWGGETTTSTAMRTRIARDSIVGTGGRTAGNVQKLNMHMAANAVFFSTTYATLQPTILVGALFGTSWNAHGGVIRWLAAPGEEFNIYDASALNCSLECRADVGTGTSSYGVIWSEP